MNPRWEEWVLSDDDFDTPDGHSTDLNDEIEEE